MYICICIDMHVFIMSVYDVYACIMCMCVYICVVAGVYEPLRSSGS
jgi:hypothetical protein